ncbi:Long-chain fatty acid transport protein 4 [Folsomia candida]|uniref:Long-chain-fatty-acid--CoA ligase n=1 Tax=Folsomia candida TaxID=158441 RepID=A0A226EGP1_FOLCA|nr:Long-chain fatty acid transport protein 4 [Folsomia candida]
MSSLLSSLITASPSFSPARALGVCLGVIGIIWIISYRKFVSAVIRTFPRDVTALFRLLHVVRDLWVLQNYNCTVSQAFDDVVRRNPKKILLRFEEQKWTAEQIQELANKVANYFQAEGYRKGDTVAIFMENCSEYTILWLGLSKIGVVSSLVNYNLRLQSLKHCFEAVSCKAIIYSPGLSTALEELDLGTKPLFCIGKETSAKLSNVSKDLMTQLRDVKGTQPVVKETIGFLDNLMYIYTSGTTGLPKASTIKNSRFLMAAVGVFYMHGLKKTDTLYTSLPLYHGAGTFLGAGTMLTYGVTQVVRKKFSASNFWKDCIAYDVTKAIQKSIFMIRGLRRRIASATESDSEDDSDSLDGTANRDPTFRENELFAPVVEDFDESEDKIRPEFGVSRRTSPLQMLQKFLTDGIIGDVVRETNRYAEQD